jgi:hypothetical protein
MLHQNVDTMSQKPLTTSEIFLEARQDFDQIPTIHVSYASSYLALLQCNLVEHQVIGITYNNIPNATHGGTITLFDVYHKATQWFFHHMNNLVLFRRYTQSLDTLELSIFIAFSFLITKVCMLKSEMSLLGVNNVIG